MRCDAGSCVAAMPDRALFFLLAHRSRICAFKDNVAAVTVLCVVALSRQVADILLPYAEKANDVIQRGNVICQPLNCISPTHPHLGSHIRIA